MTPKVPIFIISVMILINGSLVLAHSQATSQNKTLHPPTQIGLPESEMIHGHEINSDNDNMEIEGRLTRSQIADLVYEEQDKENFRSSVKLTLLIIFIIVAVLLFYPRRPTTPIVSPENAPAQQVSTIPPTSESIT